MAVHVTYPGVYVQEESSGAQAVAAASTSTALFVGMADRGPFELPTRVLSLVEYERVFGPTSPGELADQVRQFYVNGGGEAWIMRIANGAEDASVVLRNEINSADALRVTARDKGDAGNLIRAEVDYDTLDPERTFNLSLYRSVLRTDGTFEKGELESFGNLSMDPTSPRYAPGIVNGASTLVTVVDPTAPPGTINGASIGGIVYDNTAATALASLTGAITGSANTIRVAIGHRPPVNVNLTSVAAIGDIGNLIHTAYGNLGLNVGATSAWAAFAANKLLKITSPDGAVVITPSTVGNDLSQRLMLGVAAGGIEIDDATARRPAPSGVVSLLGNAMAAPAGETWLAGLGTFAAAVRNTLTQFSLTDPSNPGPALTNVACPLSVGDGAGNAIYHGAPAGVPGAIGSLAFVRTALDDIVAAVGTAAINRWSVKRLGTRIVLDPKFGGSNDANDCGLATTTLNVGAAGNIFETAMARNVAAYSVGREDSTVAPVGKQTNNNTTDVGSNGTTPLLPNYQAAFGTIESELDSFNLMLLPRAQGQSDADRKNLWGIASATAAKRRAILLVDPDAAWTSIAQAETGVAALKVGVETRNAAIYWPRLVIPDAVVTAGRTVDPSGSIAGLMARTDTRFGVWTAPAGIEATIRGIIGISKNMSDDENGVLNPKALNAIRLFPSGAVAWGARTMIGSNDTGNIDDKYIPVRRTMLFIEESLYRGLKFAVFRPNAEPLWASIRLAAGSFMNGLMRQGAFASRNKLTAYYVLCDATTTTETDINLGIVNVVVAFAPLKPAEFVILTVKQIAGQVEI